MKKTSFFTAILLGILAVGMFAVGASAQSKTIDQQVNKQIRMLPNYGVFDHITFQVNGPVVTLSGKVNSLGTKSEAEAYIKKVPGVERVVNNIVNLPPSPMDDAIRRQTLRSLSSNGLGGYFWDPNPDMRIIVENGHVTLEGYVMNKGDLNLANITANGVSNVFSVTNNLVVGKDPYRS